MNPTNFGGITGTIVSPITQKNPQGSFTVTEFRMSPVGASPEDAHIPITAYNGIGNNILGRYNKGDLISVNFRLRNKKWTESQEGEPGNQWRSRMEIVLTDNPTTIRLGNVSKAQRAEAEANKEVVTAS